MTGHIEQRLLALEKLLAQDKLDFETHSLARMIVGKLIESVRGETAPTNDGTSSYNLRALKTAYGLTPREAEVLDQIVHGASNKEAGRTIGISPRTAEDHRSNIMKKFGVKNAGGLMSVALGLANREDSTFSQEHQAHAA